MASVPAAAVAKPAPRGRRASAEETRQEIIAALVGLLDEHVIWEISIAMLTRRVGVTSQLFYRHFASLDDVLAAHWQTILSEVPDIEPLLGGEWPDEEGFERLCQISEANLAFWNRHRTVMRVLGMLDDLRQPRFAEFRAMRGRAMAQVLSALARRQQLRGRLPLSLRPEQIGWDITSRLQLFGLSYPLLEEPGVPGEQTIRSYAVMLAISLGFPVPDLNVEGDKQ